MRNTELLRVRNESKIDAWVDLNIARSKCTYAKTLREYTLITVWARGINLKPEFPLGPKVLEHFPLQS